MLTVSDEVQLESISLAFSEGESQAAINETLPYPQALATKSATLDPSQTLKVLPVMLFSCVKQHVARQRISLVADVEAGGIGGACAATSAVRQLDTHAHPHCHLYLHADLPTPVGQQAYASARPTTS